MRYFCTTAMFGAGVRTAKSRNAPRKEAGSRWVHMSRASRLRTRPLTRSCMKTLNSGFSERLRFLLRSISMAQALVMRVVAFMWSAVQNSLGQSRVI